MKPVVAVVEWFGPYSLDKARTAAFHYEDGIYCLIGKARYERESHLRSMSASPPTSGRG